MSAALELTLISAYGMADIQALVPDRICPWADRLSLSEIPCSPSRPFMQQLAANLSNHMEGFVIDKTGLTDRFDLNLGRTPKGPSSARDLQRGKSHSD